MSPIKNLRVLVVDDTIVYRKSISDIISELPGVELAGVAQNGKIALEKVKQLKPDLMTLDIEMPVMNGLEVLKELRKKYPRVGAVMLSTLTATGSEMTMQALELGAFDFVLKPRGTNLDDGKRQIKKLLQPIFSAYSRSRYFPREKKSAAKTPVALTRSKSAKKRRPSLRTASNKKSEIVAIGVSTGGPNALHLVLSELPADLNVPIVIVQHMPPLFTEFLAASLDKKCKLQVKEAQDKEPLKANTVYIAPGGKQMKLLAANDGNSRLIQITDDPPENSCKPSVDYLFRSVGDYYVGRTTAVIMTGMGTDGTKGLKYLHNRGAHIIAQDRESCVVYGMPKNPVECGYASVVAPLDCIAAKIIQSIK